LAVLASVLILQGAADAKIIYVNVAKTPSGDGTKWSRAFTYLQDALSVAATGDKIYLAKGTYYPDDFLPIGGTNPAFGDREYSFQLDGVTIYGGFAGTETNLSQRDPVANPTTLSGEIWPVTEETQGYERYWSLHVVVLKGNSTLDGLTIEKGRANGDEAPYSQGGGIYAPSGTVVTLVNCTVQGNLACESGGGVWGAVKATGCTFSDNVVDNEYLLASNTTQSRWLYNDKCYGGAINGDVTATDCKFLRNLVNTRDLRDGITTAATGGAINGTQIKLNGCLFDDNTAYSRSIYNIKTGSDATSRGGAISATGLVTAKRCVFINNSAEATSSSDTTKKAKPEDAAAPYTAKPTALGGAIAGQISAANCSFADNVALSEAPTGDNTNIQAHGGALYVENASSLVNCTFTENDASYILGTTLKSDPNNFPSSASGGAVYAAASSVLPISNSTFLDNTSTITSSTGTVSESYATALYVGGDVKVLSNIFWSTADEPLFPETLIGVALGSAKARISNRLYPTPSTETINIVKGGIEGIDIYQSNADFGDPPTRTLLDPTTPIFADVANPIGDDGLWGTPDDGLRLAEDCVAIAKGHPLFIPKDTLDIDEDGNITENVPFDVGGYTRIQDGTLDLGAYEFGGQLEIPEIIVEQPFGSALVDNASVVDFGAAIGTPVTKTFTIKNSGIGTLNRLSVSMSGDDVANFSYTQPLKSALNGGASTTFTVSFKPTEDGLRKAKVQITSNDTDENPFDIDVEGDAIVSDIAIEQPVGTGLKDGVSVINYGTVSALSSLTKIFVIRNTGKAKLKILGISKSGAAAKDFKVSVPPLTSLVTGESTTFRVAFEPTTSGTRTASITVLSDDPDSESSFLIKVTGNGVVSPEIAVMQPSSLNLEDGGTKSFGSVKTGLSYTKTFTIKNVGSATLKKLATSLSGSSKFTKTKLSVTSLKPGEKTQFTVTFKPTADGEKTATLKIASNDKDENPFDIILTGTGYSKSSATAKSALVALSASAPLGLRSPASDGSVSVVKAPDGLEYLVLTVPKTSDWGLAKHTAEVSSNLVDWFSGEKHTTTLLDDAAILRVRDNTPVKQGEKRYIRLK
jgi:hypothetical protein